MPAKGEPPIPAELLALADADTIRARVTGIVNRVLDEFEDQMDVAPPHAKRELMRSMIPALMKSLEDGETKDAEVNRLRAELDELHEQVRKGLLSVPARVIE